jgi:hypothetical protein
MAEEREVTATLVIGFGQDAALNDGMVAEVDSREDGLNHGRSIFMPGDDVYILLYVSSNVTLKTPVVSHGTLLFQPSLTPQNVEVSAEERARLLERGGFFNQA